ncbi:MAG: phenylalanine--tRNA ligase subunit beta, partial [Verrucomicrobia bacterium]|nr:phenylalanine--tRNA ligase subunit beta [Verrucomicrobiota bacterium]
NLPQSSAQPAGSLVAVRIESPDLCPKYTARVIRNIQVAPSPSWLAERLEKVGIRSINNVVDVTNYVMLETGQPLHAFDFHLLGKKADADKPCIVVRAAADQEEFTTLDGQVRRLDSGMALIADEVHAIALAGVMGGLNTEISDSTRDVLLESAAFSESATRRTSKVLGLRTDASYRFERGTDWNMVDYASQRAAALILELAGGELSPGSVDASPGVPFHRTVSLRFQKTHDLLGITIPTDAQISMLSNLGITPVPAPTPDATQQDFLIPSNRQDIKREVDLIEEIIRLYGIDHITSTPPRGCIGENPFDSQFDAIAGARHILASMGLHEAQGQTLIERSKAIDFQEQPIALNYPLSSDMDVLRPSLIPGLIDAMEHNSHHNAESISLFEIGRTFQVQQSSGEARQMESRTLAVALSGRADTPFWGGKDKDRLFDFADIKGILEELMEQIGVPVFQLQSQAQPKASWVEAADIKLGKNCLGFIGQLHPVLQKKRDIRKPAFLFELDLDMLLRLSNKSGKFKALPLYPATVRDIALFVPESVTHEEILQTIRRLKVKILESIQLFDIFRGSNVPGGYKSLAYSLTYRDSERTLTDKDVQKAHDQIVENLKSSVQATIR